MKRFKSATQVFSQGLLLCLLLCGCITEYEAKDLENITDILVVDGIITDNESVITLSRSKSLTYEDNPLDRSPYYVTDANVYIERDDGMQWSAAGQNSGQYTIETEKLNPERQYRLKIEFEANEYCSEFAYPMETPEIDSVFWSKRGTEQPVSIYVATHAPENEVLYYRWWYREEWEMRANYISEDTGSCPECMAFVDLKDIFCPNCGFELTRYPYYCWHSTFNSEILPGSSEKTVSGRVAEKLTEMPSADNKLAILYRIDVRQNVISKRAYDYYANVKKNAQQTGGLFAHVPMEMKGNISCVTDPLRKTIGYVDVSSSSIKRRYISRKDGVYERPPRLCEEMSSYQLYLQFGNIPPSYIFVANHGYVHALCVDCTYGGGTKYRPADWPDDEF